MDYRVCRPDLGLNSNLAVNDEVRKSDLSVDRKDHGDSEYVIGFIYFVLYKEI